MSAQNNAGSQVVPPPFSELQHDVIVYEEDMAVLAEVKAKLKALAKSIKNQGNVMFEVIQVFSLYQDDQAGQIRSLSAVDNLDSTLRNKLSTAQSDWNGLISQKNINKNPDAGVDYAKNLLKQIHQIEEFIKYEQGQKNPILDQASLNNLQSAINSIKTNFGSAWGHPYKMNTKAYNWYEAMTSKTNGDGGHSVPAVKNIQDGFQTLNQSVSELSSTTNSQLQFVENQYKQGLGEENSAIQAYQKLNANTIRHFTSA